MKVKLVLPVLMLALTLTLPLSVNAAEETKDDFNNMAISTINTYFGNQEHTYTRDDVKSSELYELTSTMCNYMPKSFTFIEKVPDEITVVTTKAVKNRPLILDMDLSSDVDDLPALGLACALDKLEVFDIKGVMLSVRGEDDRNLAAVNGFLKSEGLTDVLVGKCENEHIDTSVYWNLMNGEGDAFTNVDFTTNQYRRILANAEDNSVDILTTGYLENIYYLMNSNPDEISSLSGIELIYQKVNRLFIVGGSVPEGLDNNFQIIPDSMVAADAIARNFPRQVIYITNDTGGKMICGRYLERFDTENTYAVTKGLKEYGATDGYIAWDPFGVFVCAFIDNPSISKCSLLRTNITVNPKNGVNQFVDDMFGRHYRVVVDEPNLEYYNKLMDSFIIHNVFY